MELAVSHPPIPKEIPTWGNLERLNKERELVGIYLSAHPLDEYSVILDYVCNTKLPQLEEQKEELSHLEDVTIGGIVTSIRVGESKTGNPYGIVKMEDFTGSGEIPLFGRDWLTYRSFFMEGASLFIRLKFEPHRFKPGVFNLVISSVELLAEIKDQLIQKITFEVPLDKLTVAMVEDLAEIVKENPGNADLVFNIHAADNTQLSLLSRQTKLHVGLPIVQFIREHPDINIHIN